MLHITRYFFHSTYTLVNSILNPSILVNGKDLISLYIESVGNDCRQGLQFGMEIIQSIRNAREVLGTQLLTQYIQLVFILLFNTTLQNEFLYILIDFYHKTQDIDSFDWEEMFPLLAPKVFDVVTDCMQNARYQAVQELTTLKVSSISKIHADLTNKFPPYEWFVYAATSKKLAKNTYIADVGELLGKSKFILQ